MAKEKSTKSIEETLWDSANKLRGTVESSEYKHVVLGLIFLKFVSDKFEERRKELIAEGKEKYLEMKEFYNMKNVFYLAEESRWDLIIGRSKEGGVARMSHVKKIKEIQAAYESIIARINRVSTVRSNHKYFAIPQPNLHSKEAFQFEIEEVETETETDAKVIIQQWRGKNRLQIPRDIFNDKMDYSTASYDQLKVRKSIPANHSIMTPSSLRQLAT